MGTDSGGVVVGVVVRGVGDCDESWVVKIKSDSWLGGDVSSTGRVSVGISVMTVWV